MLTAKLRPTAFFALTAGLVACGTWDDHTKARDVAREVLGCFAVEVERTEAHRFHAEGCGNEADLVCSEGSLEPVCIQVRPHGALAATAGGETVDVEEDATPVSAPEEASAAEVAIRAGLDARSEDILACVDRASVAVRVSHLADGSLSITLSGDLRDTPEEGCVRDALGGVRVGAGPPGLVVHLVRARRASAPASDEIPSPALESPPPTPMPSAGPAPNGEVIEELPL